MVYNYVMDKNILSHEKFMETEIKNLNNRLENAKDKDEIDNIKEGITNLGQYHSEAVHNFQHERFIHLVVTLFFAALLFLSLYVMYSFASAASPLDDTLLLTGLTLAIVAILFVTEIFYIRHYYQLENGTQRLYRFSKELYDLVSDVY